MGNNKPLIFFIKILLLFFIWIEPIYCNEEKWKVFFVDPVPSFEYPAEMIVEGAGPDDDLFDWTYTLKTKNNEFTIFSSGFYRVFEHLRKPQENSYSYILRELKNEYGDNITYLMKNKTIILVVSIKNGIKTVHKFWLGGEHASDQAVNELIISYPYSKRNIYDKWMQRVEASWKPKYVRRYGWGCE